MRRPVDTVQEQEKYVQSEKKPAFIGVSTKDRKNHGNIIHAVAARRLLPEGTEYQGFKPWSDEEIERIRSHSHLVVVMANAISLGVDESPMSALHRIMADNIERLNMPTVVLGLGSQAEAGEAAKQTIPAGTLKLIQVLGEHSQSIACRGAFTAEVVAHHGVSNVEAIGCQSTFWHGAELPFEYGRREVSNNIAFNYSMIRNEAKLIEWCVKSNLIMIGQTEFWEEDVAKSKDPKIGPRQKYLFANTRISENEYRTFCSKRFRWFTTVSAWMDFMSPLPLSVGTRFHGNMASMISGTPSLWFAHDQRTHELCKLLSLPHIPLEDALADMRIERFMELADFADFRKNYRDNYERFKTYIERAGLHLRF